ncbi:BMP family ABC transporter substrate-binding protein [Filobacillus milosensis]|uniref:BMP family ABC transporter substrate-binding protein n=1 Tax=Filobacillus milosensis TaxID=94137 RepID=A0A4Y8IQT2_9BACI|nr:BMP family protein [Filobacillus milosensis]TFB23154.1 BMP family ABC transporter substrate-binding protein [Filobacillus milosensis]
MKKLNLLLTMLLTLTVILSACGTNGDSSEGQKDCEPDSSAIKAGIVTDEGGVDDKSFNQSAWEGLKAYGEEYCLDKDEMYGYAQSNQDSEYESNLTRLTQQDYELIFGIGFKLKDAVQTVASQNPDTKYALVDDVAEGDNVASVTFKEHQGSFLVGVAAALKSETGKVGFVGGIDSPLINKFEAGYVAGVKSVDPSIEVDVRYAESFSDAGKGRQIAKSMYDSNVDVIYHAAGGAGNGVFTEAKDIKAGDSEANVWVIGVDRDQYEEGSVDDSNVTLTSMVKRVDVAVQDVIKRTIEGNFPGGEVLEYGLADGGISVADTNEEAYTDEIASKVKEWKEKIQNGDVEVPQTREELEGFVSNLE